MPDLVERLRYLTVSKEYVAAPELCKEAADEIDRLRAALKAAFDASLIGQNPSDQSGAVLHHLRVVESICRRALARREG